jgi:hypothetical protein
MRRTEAKFGNNTNRGTSNRSSGSWDVRERNILSAPPSDPTRCPIPIREEQSALNRAADLPKRPARLTAANPRLPSEVLLPRGDVRLGARVGDDGEVTGLLLRPDGLIFFAAILSGRTHEFRLTKRRAPLAAEPPTSKPAWAGSIPAGDSSRPLLSSRRYLIPVDIPTEDSPSLLRSARVHKANCRFLRRA